MYYIDSISTTIAGENDGNPIPSSGYTLDNGAKVKVEYVPNGPQTIGPQSGTINIFVWNPEITPKGNYSINLDKTGMDSPYYNIPGIQFEASGTFGGNSYDIPSAGNYLVTKEADESVPVMPEGMTKIDIDSSTYSTPDEIILKEVGYENTQEGQETRRGYKLGFQDEEIKLIIYKDVDNTDPLNPEYYVSEIRLKVGDTEVNPENPYHSTYTVQDGSMIKVTYAPDTRNINIRAVNPVKEGSFKINLVKKIYGVDENSDGEDDPLEGAVFNVTVNDGTRDIVTATNLTTDEYGEIPEISGIDITDENLTYTITVTEVSAPEGYIGLGTPITFEAKSKFDGTNYVLDIDQQPTITNEYIQAEVNADEIIIEAENRVEPIIHKGVRTVTNQNSGYDKNELQEWVIVTTVPVGIEDYTKYIVTDTIDGKKTNVNEKRIAFVNESNPGSNVSIRNLQTFEDLTEGTDYKVEFNTETKELKIIFINETDDENNFVGGRNLTEDTALEITYHTQFTLDENGVPIGLNEMIENQATLTYNGNGNEEKEKKSEEPEVHTGGLGVYKFDIDTGEALEGAKFRLTRTEEEAEAAIVALLNNDQEAFDAIDWVKKHNNDGSLGDVWEETTDSSGYAEFTGLEFGSYAEDFIIPMWPYMGVGQYGAICYEFEDAETTYYLVEVYVPGDYILLDEPVECSVMYNNFDITDLTTYHEVGNELQVSEGEYAVQIAKYGKKANGDLEPIQGVGFSAKRTINGLAEEDLGTLTATDTTGTTIVGSTVTIDKDHVSTADEYTIREVSVPNDSDYYIGLDKDIKLTVNKQSVLSDDRTTWTNSVTGINMTIDGETVNEVVAGKKYTATVTKDGQQLLITAELVETDGQIVKLTVENPHKTGTFPLHIIKTIKGTNPVKPLANAGFKVSIKNGNEYVETTDGTAIDGTHEYITEADGSILINNLDISRPGETYTVEIEESTVPDGYIGISGKVTYTVTSIIDENGLTLQPVRETELTNDVKYEVKDGEIWNYVENKPEPVVHKGVKTVENQNAGYDKNEVQTWVINTTVPAGIADYTKYVVTDTIDSEKTNVAEKRIKFLNESNPASNVSVKYKGTDTVLTEGTDYKVAFDTTTKQLRITFINATDDENNFVGGRSLTEGTTLEITYKTQFTLDENGVPIGLNEKIENEATLTYNGNGNEEKEKESETPEVHTGGLGVFKYDRTTNRALEGAKFRLVRTQNEAEAAVDAVLSGDQDDIDAINWVKQYNSDGTEGAVWEVTTGSDGYAYFAGLEFGGDAEGKVAQTTHSETGAPIYTYDWTNASTTYYLIETYVPDDYIILDEVAAECEVKYNNFEIVDLTTYHKVGNDIVVPEGGYAVEIAKYGKDEDEELHPIQGVIFSAKRIINGLAEENLGNLTETDGTGKTVVGNAVTIDKDQVSTNDVYTIHEVNVPENSEYYIGLDKDIVLTISKQSVKSDDNTKWLNSVTGIEMSIEGETVTEVVAGKKYTATVTKDGQSLLVTAELTTDDNNGQLIKLTVENPHKAGTFKFNIIKTIKGTNTVKPLANAGFKVSIKNGNEFVKTTNGTAIDGTNEYVTGDNGSIVIDNLDIRRAGETYTVELVESTVPNGYIGINDTITYTVTSVVDGNKLSLAPVEETTVSNDVKYEVKDGEIWNYIENKPEPVVHKGVKTVENQDAGYDGDEVQTWVINSTIPYGINDYIKYVVTDTIDKDIANNADKRIEFIDEVHPENNVVVKYKGTNTVLTAGTDYLVDFDRNTKQLKITFIDGDFVKGKELNENSTLEITFKTKFRLDAEGRIIGLNQKIPNTAELTFGVDGQDEKTKESESPEVHTGAVGVIKYEDVNNNKEFDDEDKVLEGAHFKIVRTEDEARRAVAAVLAGDRTTLNSINFVKVRDANGNPSNTDVELITDEHGEATYEGLEFGEDASNKESNRTSNGKGGSTVYEYNWETAKTTYYLVETEAPEEYYLLDKYEAFEVSKNSFARLDYSKYYKEANKPKEYDLSLRKFITHVDGTDCEGNAIDRNITDREPIVTISEEFKNGSVTTAEYNHTKDPVIVEQGNIVTYTIRVYNESSEDAYASIVKDDIPDGVEFIKYTEGDGSVNDKYRWKLVDENDNEVDDVSKAKYIVTDYLSMEQGKTVNGVNTNLLKGYNSNTMKELDYRDLKVQFLVTESNESERIITNYAQIAKMTNGKGSVVKDRDSNPNEWNEGEDDQDVEHIRLLYFDLALRKWVTKAKVTQDGKETVYETGHKAEDDPEDVVKVDLKKSKINSVVVKFEYQIRITNEGRIGGWCDEITDHIPDGLVFEQADNPIWTVVDEKTITTDALKDTYLEPGESAEVTVVLRWVNSADNLGIKVNVAEISKDRNPYGVHDIDSTPGNYKWGEDDIDDAPVMLAIKTGNRAVGYAVLGLIVVSIIAAGIVAVKNVRKE